MFTSSARYLKQIQFPAHVGRRISMMPFDTEQIDSLHPAQVGGYRKTVFELLNCCEYQPGIAYLTIDESYIEAGTTQRRPGLHVDGYGPYGGGGYGKAGMVCAASTGGFRMFLGTFEGTLGLNGEADSIRAIEASEAIAEDNVAYWCAPLCVHEAVPMTHSGPRQFLRISLPSDAAFHWPYTPNITGVVPKTAPGPDRNAFMAYRMV